MSRTLTEVQESTKAELENPEREYTQTNLALGMGQKIGNLQLNALKARRAAKGSTIVKHDETKSAQTFEEEMGQLLWLMAAWCERRGTTLDKCMEAGNAKQATKRS